MLASGLGETMEKRAAVTGLTVLFAEDDRLLRDLASTRLRQAGFIVFEVESGEEALAMLASGQRVDMLVTDIRMAGKLDGWELAERVRSLDASVRVVYMTSGKRDPARQVADSFFVQKPYRIGRLLAAVLAAAGSV